MASEAKTRRSSRGSCSDPAQPPSPTSSTAVSVSCTLCHTTESLVWLPHPDTNTPLHTSDQVVLCTTCAAAQHSGHNTRQSRKQRHNSTSSTTSSHTATRDARDKDRPMPTSSNEPTNDNTAQLPIDPTDPLKSNQFRYPRKRKPFRAEVAPSTSVVEQAYHQGVRFEPGDIVSVIDRDNQGFYFAFIRGLISNIEANKFAFLTWLLPFEPVGVKCATKPAFVPSKYCMGPQDFRARPIECLRFECSSPLSASYRYPRSKIDSPFM